MNSHINTQINDTLNTFNIVALQSSISIVLTAGDIEYTDFFSAEG